MAWSHLLAASDDSPAALHALHVAQALAESLGVRLSVVTVLRSPQERLAPCLARYRPRVAYGHPGIEIVRAARELGADIIILGRSDGSNGAAPELGATADAVVRRSDRLCLFVPLGQERLDHAVVALDGTERGLSVLTTALELARASGTCLEAIFVESPAPRSAGEPASPRSLRILQALSTAGRQRGPVWPLRVLRGDPVECLRAELQEANRDVLVIGSRRGGPPGPPDSTGVGRALLYTAPCAVLTVPL